MINELRNAIYNRVNGETNSLKTLLGDRFYYLSAPDHCDYPYGVFFEIANNQEMTTGTEKEEYPIQISVYQKTTHPEDLGNAESYIKERFKNCESSLSVDEYDVVRVTGPRCRSVNTGDPELKHTLAELTIELSKTR